jgi:hypothetical protein
MSGRRVLKGVALVLTDGYPEQDTEGQTTQHQREEHSDREPPWERLEAPAGGPQGARVAVCHVEGWSFSRRSTESSLSSLLMAVTVAMRPPPTFDATTIRSPAL